MKKALVLLVVLTISAVAAQAANEVIQYTYESNSLAPSLQTNGFVATNTAKVGGGTILTPTSSVTGINGFVQSNVWSNSATFNSTDYWTFTVTNNNGDAWNFTGFTFDAGRSNTGPTSFELRTNAAGDNFTTTLLSGTTIPNGNGNANNAGSWGNFGGAINVTIGAGATEEFRLYGFNASNATAGTFRIDNVTFTAVSAIPEPGSAALLGLGGLGAILFARRRRR